MLSGRWTNSHRCSWITVYVSCCNAQMNLILDTMTCTCIVMHLSIYQLHSYNLFTQHISYLLWRDTTSELWTLVHSFTSEYTIFCNHCSLHFLQVTIIFHTIYTSNPFIFSKPVRLTTSLLSWGKISWLCCVQVPCWQRNLWCCAVLSFVINTFRSTFISYWFDKPWFHTEGKLVTALIIPSSRGLPTSVCITCYHWSDH